MKKFKVGLQLFSVRDEIAADMDAALEKIKEIGYDCVEFAGFFDHSAEEVKAMLDKYDLKGISVHQVPEVFLEQGQESIDYLKKIGVEYCAVPWYPVENYQTEETRQNAIEVFTKYGEALKKNGIQLMYHNHDFEFNLIDGQPILDWLYATIPADILWPQLDTCWVKYAGYDPCEYINKYAGRMNVLHLKDFVCKNLASGPVYALIDKNGNTSKPSTREENEFFFKPLGTGMQDFPSILKAAEAADIDYLIVEQDQSYEDATPMENAKISRDYLKSLGI